MEIWTTRGNPHVTSKAVGREWPKRMKKVGSPKAKNGNRRGDKKLLDSLLVESDKSMNIIQPTPTTPLLLHESTTRVFLDAAAVKARA